MKQNKYNRLQNVGYHLAHLDDVELRIVLRAMIYYNTRLVQSKARKNFYSSLGIWLAHVRLATRGFFEEPKLDRISIELFVEDDKQMFSISKGGKLMKRDTLSNLGTLSMHLGTILEAENSRIMEREPNCTFVGEKK